MYVTLRLDYVFRSPTDEPPFLYPIDAVKMLRAHWAEKRKDNRRIRSA